MTTTEHKDLHEVENITEKEHGDHFIFENFQRWNQLSSSGIMVAIIVFGSVANVFLTYCIYKNKVGTNYINPVLLAISLKNVIALTTCVPLAVIMLNFPTSIIKLTCNIQENITFIILFAGFLFPALLSLVQCDHVISPHRHILGGKRIFFVICLVTTISVLMGVQSELSSDEHGCHLWSIITDKVVLTYIYSVGIIVIFTLTTMIACYMMIYNQARARQMAVESSIQRSRVISTGVSPGVSGIHANGEQNRQAVDLVPLRRKMTTAILKPMFCIVITNIMTSFSWIILYVFTAYDQIENSLNYAEGRILTMAIMYIPIATDPIIFLSFSTKGRQAIKTLFSKRGATVNPLPNTATMTRQGLIVMCANRTV